MEFNFGVIKRHPYLIGGIVLVVGGYIFYRIYKGSASTTNLSSGDQLQALTSAQQLQNSQIQGQLDLQQGQATAQIAVIGATYQGQVDLAKQGQNVYDDYLKTQTDLATISSTTELGVANIQANTTTNVATIQAGAATDITQIQADVMNQQTAAQLSVYQGELAFKADVADKILSGDYLRKAESTGRSQVVAALFGTGAPSPQSYTSGSTSFGIGIPGIGSVGVKQG